MTNTMIRDLAQSDIWTAPWFREMFVCGLRRDGVDESSLTLIDGAFSKAPKSIADLQVAVGASGSAAATKAVAALDGLAALAKINETCYLRDTVERSRVINWPNNPKMKYEDPEFYFDIFKDHFYRIPHRFIDRNTPIGSAGSCFALRIAHQLQRWGYNYVIEEDDLPEGIPLNQIGALASKVSYRAAPARWGTLFNMPSMRQMAERAFGVWTAEKLVVQGEVKRIGDPFRSVRPLYSTLEGYDADYEAHNNALRRALMRCDVFILTLGLTEAWQFAHSGDFVSVAPHRIDASLLRRRNLTVEENVAELERFRDVYRAHKPNIKLIISVSPVPLNKTFSQENHVVVASTYSKAVLRVAAEQFCSRHPEDCFYFPAYETVTLGTKNAWEEDMRHVSPEAVSRVMSLFRAMFFVDQNGEFPDMWEGETEREVPTIGKKIRYLARRMRRLLKKLRQ